MTLGSSMLSLAMSEVLDGAVLLLGVLMCVSTLYLLMLHLARVIRNRLGEEGDEAKAGGG